jgi:hypothetical protein
MMRSAAAFVGVAASSSPFRHRHGILAKPGHVGAGAQIIFALRHAEATLQM